MVNRRRMKFCAIMSLFESEAVSESVFVIAMSVFTNNSLYSLIL